MPFLGLIVFVAMATALIDVILADDARVRSLPKLAWVGIVLVLPLAGPVIWFMLGRPLGGARGTALTPYPDDDEEFLRQVRQRVEEQRRNAPRSNDGKDAGATG